MSLGVSGSNYNNYNDYYSYLSNQDSAAIDQMKQTMQVIDQMKQTMQVIEDKIEQLKQSSGYEADDLRFFINQQLEALNNQYNQLRNTKLEKSLESTSTDIMERMRTAIDFMAKAPKS